MGLKEGKLFPVIYTSELLHKMQQNVAICFISGTSVMRLSHDCSSYTNSMITLFCSKSHISN